MFGGRVVKAPLGAALGVAAILHRGVDGEDQRPVAGAVLDQEPAQPVLVHPSVGKGLVEAAVRAGELGLEAERRHGADGATGAQGGVGQLEQGIGPTGAAGIEARPELDKLIRFP